MRSRGFWLPVMTAALLASSAGGDASAQDIIIETSAWMPTSRVLSVSVPTTYLATSYAIPTTFAAPTVYATSYVTERVVAAPASVVVPTVYETYRPSLFGRRLIPTGRTYVAPTRYFPTSLYVPSAYYVPTVSTFPTSFVSVPSIVDRAVITTGAVVRETSACCPDAIAMSPTTVTTRPIAPERSTRSNAEPAPRRPSVRSEPNIDDEPALESGVEPLPAPAAPARPRAQTPPAQSAAPAPAAPREIPQNTESPPPPQAPQERQQSTARPDGEIPAPTAPAGEMEPTPIPAPKAPSADEDLVPLAPAGTDDLLPAPSEMGSLDNAFRREAQRPVFTPTRAPEPSVRNILFGRVREHVNNEPEEGVRVLLTNRGGSFEERVAMTDAFGRFAVRVPDGDWDVKVTMPSGRIYTVSQITVSRGEITDDQGRDIPSLTITR